MIGPTLAAAPRDRILIVGPGVGENGGLSKQLASQFSDWTIASADSYFDGIADLARSPARLVLANIDTTLAQMGAAVAGLREAAGRECKLFLVCPPDAEPAARQVVECGADDYLLTPLNLKELGDAMGITPCTTGVVTASPADEPRALATLLGEVGGAPSALLARAADWIRAAFGSQSAQVVVQGTAATSGGALDKPVLTAPIPGGERPIGQVFLGARAAAYTLSDANRLASCAEVIARVLALAGEQRTLRTLASTDECSGLHNRRFFQQKLAEVLDQARAERASVSVLFFDLDDFKGYNDQFGHGAGDEILRTTAALMKRCCREHDVVARFGGDEFAVIFWDPDGPRTAGSKHPQCALTVLDRFQTALRTQEFPLLGPTGRGRLTISGGLATFPWDGSTPEELVRRADEALLAAKRAGKNRIQLIGGGSE